MSDRWRRRGLAAAFILIGWPFAAHAQTVIVKGIPAGTTVDLGLNGPTVATATPDADGLTTLTIPAEKALATQTRLNLFVDRCPTGRRIELADAGLTPPNEGGCARDTVAWTFLVQRGSTLVLDVAGASPIVRLTQGKPPESWLRYSLDQVQEETPWGPPPVGLIVGASTGLTRFTGVQSVICGDTLCSAKVMPASYSFGAVYRLNQFLGAEVQYVKPSDATVKDGRGTGFDYTGSLKTELFTIAGQVSAPAGRVRFFARAGANRHATSVLTTQNVAEQTITLTDGTVTVPAGTISSEFRTNGWGTLFGGGTEIWLSHRLLLNTDLTRASVGGNIIGLPETTLKHAAWVIQVGARVRVF